MRYGTLGHFWKIPRMSRVVRVGTGRHLLQFWGSKHCLHALSSAGDFEPRASYVEISTHVNTEVSKIICTPTLSRHS